MATSGTATRKELIQPSNIPTCDRNEECKNGGTCKFDTENGVSSCHCSERYFGPNCVTYCPLQCNNGGTCHLKEADTIGEEHSYGLDTNTDHYECRCPDNFTGRHCDDPFVACPDGSKCLNGGECAESVTDASVYKCVCPYGFEGNKCEGAGEIRTYFKGPVTKEPVREGRLLAEIVVASLAIVAAVVLFILMRQKKQRKQALENDDGLDDLMMLGRYSDKGSDDEDDDENGIETTLVR